MSDTPRTDAKTAASCADNDGGFLAEDMLFFARELERELATENAINQRNCQDWAHDHTYLQKLCREVGFSEHDVEGDKYGIRAITQLSDMLRLRVSEKERENARLRDAGNRMADMLALAPGSPVECWPTDDAIMAAVSAWRAAFAVATG